MEHSAPVDRHSHATAHSRTPSASTWDKPEQPPAFVAQMEQLLGEHSEPDTAFFVDTWTMGVEAAAQSFQTRQHVATMRDSNTPTFRSFDFSVPLFFVEESMPHAYMPAGFSAGLKEAYGFSGSPFSYDAAAPQNRIPQDGAAFSVHESSLPLTSQSACRLLGVAATSTRDQIKSAYRQLVRQYHPDRLEHSSDQQRRIATDRMISINEAYHLLCSRAIAAS